MPDDFPVNWKYEYLDTIGQGAMGKVYKARDRHLNRIVALKFVIGKSTELNQRFYREARAQAQVQHQNVCQIHEVGQSDGRLFISMQYIEGQTLDAVKSEMTLDEKVQVVKQVAEGIQAAHSAGLIHRDLKPGNIMVERAESGWRPYIVDFGLVREVEAKGMTETGMIVGTPSYMAPEQVWGESQKLDRRADIYSLGVTLYHMLSDSYPIDAEVSLDFFRKLVDEEPKPLLESAPSTPSDLNTIVMKCIEKDPVRRYESARALADELQRYLDGEPIVAKPSSLSYRWGKKIRKNKTLFAVSTIAVISVLVLGSLWIRSWLEAGRKAELAQDFGQQVERIDSFLRIAHTIPLHNSKSEREQVQKQMESLSEQMKSLGKIAEGPGNYALGRGYLSLNDPQNALLYLQKAWDLEYRPSEVSYALGLALGKIYQIELEKAQALRNEDVRKLRQKEIEITYRDPALNYLKQSSGSQLTTSEYAEGLIAFLEKRFEDALRMAGKSIASFPWLYEARLLQGDVYMDIAAEKRNAGKPEEALTSLEKAEEAFSSAAMIGESDPVVYERLCKSWVGRMQLDVYTTGKDLKPFLDRALESAEKALAADPEFSRAYVQMSAALWIFGSSQVQHGENPLESYRKSIEAGEKAIELDPKDAQAFVNHGTAYQLLADFQQKTGEVPSEPLETAIQSYRKAMSLNPGDVYIYNSLGNTYAIRGDYDKSTGQDPRRWYRESINTFRKGIQLNPNVAFLHDNLAITYAEYSTYEQSIGLESVEYLDLAIDSYRKAIQIKPDSVFTRNNLGNAYIEKAKYQFNHGQNPQESLRQALDPLDEATKLNPDYASPYSNRSTVYLQLARWEFLQGRDPTPLLQKSLQNAEKALEIRSNHVGYYLDIAQCYLLQAESELRQGQPVSETLQKARDITQRGLEVRPNEALGHRLLGQVETLAVRQRIRDGKSPVAPYEKAKQAFARSLDINSESPYSLVSLAELYFWLAESSLRRPSDATPLIEEGLRSADKAIQINNGLATAHRSRGILLLFKARIQRTTEQRTEVAKGSVEALQKVLQINTNLEPLTRNYLEQAEELLHTK